MARSIAELGGGYYAQANSDLHTAIATDPAVLMGQYDLQKQFGEERLKKVISELKDIATSSQDNTLHSFLLTFCYYNSRHIGQAADWLQITDRRSGGQDPAITQMKKYWNFNDEAPIPVPPPVQPHAAVSPQSAGPATQPRGRPGKHSPLFSGIALRCARLVSAQKKAPDGGIRGVTPFRKGGRPRGCLDG